MACVGTLRPIGLRRRLTKALGIADMFERLFRFLRYATGARSIIVHEVSKNRLALRCGGLQTVVDKSSKQVIQNGKLVAMLSQVEGIELRRHFTRDSIPSWWVTLLVKGEKRIAVGESTDETDASLVSAHLATISSRQVILKK